MNRIKAPYTARGWALLVFICLTASAYTQNTIRGFVIDAKSQAGIEGVSIINRLSGKGSISGSDGYFTMKVEHFPLILNLSHLAYERTFKTIDEFTEQVLKIPMIPKAIKLDEVMITAKPYIDLTRDKPLYVRGFEFVEDKILMLVHRDIKMNKPELVAADLTGKELHQVSLTRPEKIELDCFGQIQVLNYFSAYQVGYHQDSLFLMEPVSRDLYHSWMDKAYLAIGDTLLLRQFDEGGQEVTYSFVHETWTDFKILRSITNRKTTIDYQYWADFMTSEFYENLIMLGTDMLDSLDFNLFGLGTGALTGGSHIMDSKRGDSRGGRSFGSPSAKLNMLRHTTYQQQYLQYVNFVDLYAPLFRFEDQLALFNCVDNQLEVYDLGGRLINLKPIDFHLIPNWAKRIIQDPRTGRIYTLYSYGFDKTLKEISVTTGEIIKSITLPKFPHMTDFKVYNGSLYFLYTKKMGGIEEPTHLYKIPLGL